MKERLGITDAQGHVLVHDPPIAQLLFSSTRLAWLWLIVRLWVGYQWLQAAIGVNYFLGLGGKPGKLFDPAWMQGSTAIRGFWERAVAVPPDPATKPLVVFDWYREFLGFLLATNSDVWFSKLIVAGELLIGLALVVGALTGIAAFFGGILNWSFMMAGTLSVSPLMFLLTVLLILAWKVAGYYGLDRVLLPVLGTPWERTVGPTARVSRPPQVASSQGPAIAYKPQ